MALYFFFSFQRMLLLRIGFDWLLAKGLERGVRSSTVEASVNVSRGGDSPTEALHRKLSSLAHEHFELGLHSLLQLYMSAELLGDRHRVS